MKKSPALLAAGIGALALLERAAFAHPGHTGGFAAGLTHPLTGVDHVAAMFAVGLWAAQSGKRATWLVPLSFVVMMFAGAGLAFAGMPLPFAEQGIAASVLVLGLLIVFGMKMPTSAGMLLVGVFAIFHGWAHGHELTQGASAVQFAIGFGSATIMLHLAGIGLGVALASVKQQRWTRLVGAAMVLLAGLLVAGVM